MVQLVLWIAMTKVVLRNSTRLVGRRTRWFNSVEEEARLRAEAWIRAVAEEAETASPASICAGKEQQPGRV